jgi:hypothetical protein
MLAAVRTWHLTNSEAEQKNLKERDCLGEAGIWEDNIKINPKETVYECNDWIRLVQNSYHTWMKYRVTQKTFLYQES